MNEFKMPVSGRAIKWRSLKVGEEIDVALAHTGDLKAVSGYELLRKRIVDSGAGKPMEIGEWRDLDAMDADAFADEVERVESARKASLSKGADGPLR